MTQAIYLCFGLLAIKICVFFFLWEGISQHEGEFSEKEGFEGHLMKLRNPFFFFFTLDDCTAKTECVLHITNHAMGMKLGNEKKNCRPD